MSCPNAKKPAATPVFSRVSSKDAYARPFSPRTFVEIAVTFVMSPRVLAETLRTFAGIVVTFVISARVPAETLRTFIETVRTFFSFEWSPLFLHCLLCGLCVFALNFCGPKAFSRKARKDRKERTYPNSNRPTTTLLKAFENRREIA